MDTAYISALSALAGSVVGGFTSGATTWLTQRAQARAGMLAHAVSRREDLFKEFVIEASNAYGKALVSNEPDIHELVGLYAMVSRMRVLCSPRTVECAENVMIATTDTYLAPNKTVSELHELIKNGPGIDPLKEFAEAAREELRRFPVLF
jgi:hypothetical protein